MGGVRNGKSAGTPEPAAARQEALQPGASGVKPAEDASEAVDRHFRSAVRLLREGSAARAFGELARASRTLPMTPRLAAGLVRFALLAGTEAAAITLLDAVPGSAPAEVRRAVRRQLARVLRRVDQLPRAIAALDALLAEFPGDRRARRGLQVLHARVGDAAAPVLGKLPTRKAGVQAHAVWEEEDSGYRVETVVEPPLGAPEGTAVAFPSLSTPRAPEAGAPEGTAVAFPALSAPRAPEVPWGEPAAKAVAQPESRTKTEIELPALGAVPDSPTESRTRTETELPAVPWVAPGASGPEPRKVEAASGPEPRSKAEAGPAGGRDAAAEPRTKTEVELPALGPTPPETPAKTVVEMPALGAAPDSRAVGPEDLSVPWSAPRPKATGDTGEITSRALPFPPESAAPPPPPVKEQSAEPSPPPPPGATQEIVMADLVAALGGAKPASARAEAPRATEPQAPGKARAEGEGAEAGPRDAEELSRSQKLEAQLIARQAWRELAQLYLKRADRARDATVRAEALTRLAEVMENELQDPAGAARMYREIVELTGDRAALREQVRLLTGRGDASLVRRALDEAIDRARTARARAGALLTRGERWLHMGELQKARADFEAAEALSPGLLPVLAGLVRCAGDSERPAATERLRAALAAAPRRALDRIEGLRVLAQTAEESLGDLRLAQWAWSEVATESPESEQAPAKLVALARRLGDRPSLGQLLRAQLAREPRGPAARQARLELVSTLDAQGDAEAALTELRQAVRYEPGHKEAWLLLVDRLTALGNMGEAAWALEHAATAMEDELERERAWERLARFWREVLGNPERAQVFSRRAEGIRQAREERELPPPPEPARGAAPRSEPGEPKPPLGPPPPALKPAALKGMADEVTSNTDLSAGPPAVEAPASGAARAEASPGVNGASPPVPRAASADAVAPTGAAATRGERSARAPRVMQPPRLERIPTPPPSEPAASRVPAASKTDKGAAATERAPAVQKSDKGAAATERAPAVQKSDKGAAAAERAPAASKSDKGATPDERGPSEPKADKGAAPTERAPSVKGDKAAAPTERAPAVSKSDKASAPASRAPAVSKSDKGAAPNEPAASRSPRTAPPVSDAEARAQAPGASRAPDSPRGRDAKSERPQAVDLMSGEPMDLGEAPVADTRVISWEAPPGRMDPVRRVVRSRQDGPAPAAPAPAQGRTFIAKPPPAPEVREPPARPGAAETREAPVVDPHPDTEPDAFRHIRERPLDAKPYRQLAEFFDSRGDPARATLMREIADALDGREPTAPRAQRPPLSSEERAGLRHPGLRTSSGELLACTGLALCRLFPAQGRAASTLEPLRASSGPGAPAVLDALHTVARLLDVNLPELVLAEDDGPPFTAVHAGNPRVLVGRLALRQAPSPAELRFHAGRALLSLSPDLLALRTLKGGQLLRALALLSTVLKDPRANTSDARVVRESLAPRALERAVALLEPGTRDFNASALVDAARDSANRAGLVACGAVGPALAALRARRASDSELVELLRFAASERYLALRAPR